MDTNATLAAPPPTSPTPAPAVAPTASGANPAPVDAGARADTPEPVNTTPMEQPVPSEVRTPASDPGYRMPMPAAEFQRVLADQVSAIVQPLHAKIQELEGQLGQSSKPEPPPPQGPTIPDSAIRLARADLGEHASDAHVQQLAHAQDQYDQWFRLQKHPEHGAKAAQALREWEERIALVKWRAGIDADRAARQVDNQSGNAQGEPEPPLPSSVGEAIAALRTNLSAEWLQQHYPHLGGAVHAGHEALASILDGLDLARQPSSEAVLNAVANELTALDRHYKRRPSTPPSPRAPGNPGAFAPTTPAGAGHTGRGNILDADAYNKGLQAAAAAGLTR